jgi:hypothetical protein
MSFSVGCFPAIPQKTTTLEVIKERTGDVSHDALSSSGIGNSIRIVNETEVAKQPLSTHHISSWRIQVNTWQQQKSASVIFLDRPCDV